MAQDKKVEQITSMEDDFAQWYTDICKKAELIDYSSVKGFMILRPYGYAIWENIQRIMDAPPLRPCSATTGTASFRPTASSPCSITSGAP